jgi:DNA-binding GntR family transcriptional regulator
VEVIGVTESAVQYLRVHIITGELAPGQKLNEMELSSRLSISRPPLREAFRILENEHLIVSIPRKGCYVTEISMEDYRGIFEAREMIECFAIDLLRAKNIRNLPHVASALKVTADLPAPTSSDPYEKFSYLKAIANFHIKLVESADNARLNRFYYSIFSNLARYQDMYIYIPGLMDKSQEDHKRVLDLIRSGNYVEAREFLRAHVNSFYNFIEEVIAEKSPDPAGRI